MGNDFSLLVDRIHAKDPSQRLAELCRQLEDPEIFTLISQGAKDLKLPFRIIKPSKTKKRSCSYEVSWVPNTQTLDTWSKDVNLFWAPRPCSLPSDRNSPSHLADAIIEKKHIDAIQVRFQKLAFYDFVVQCTPGRLITIQRCRDAAEYFWGSHYDADVLGKSAEIILEHARNGHSYHLLAEQYGDEILLAISPKLDKYITIPGGKNFGKAGKIIEKLSPPRKAEKLRECAKSIRASTVRRWSRPCSGVPQVLNQGHGKDQSTSKRDPTKGSEYAQDALQASHSPEEQAPPGPIAQKRSAVATWERQSSPFDGTRERRLPDPTRRMMECLEQPLPASTSATTARGSHLDGCSSISTDQGTLSNDSSKRPIETLMIDFSDPPRTGHDTATVTLEPSQSQMESPSDRETLSDRSEETLTEDHSQTWAGQMMSSTDGDGKSEIASATNDKVSDQFADPLTSCDPRLPDLRPYSEPTVDPKMLDLRQPTTNAQLPDLRPYGEPTMDPNMSGFGLHSQPTTGPQIQPINDRSDVVRP